MTKTVTKLISTGEIVHVIRTETVKIKGKNTTYCLILVPIQPRPLIMFRKGACQSRHRQARHMRVRQDKIKREAVS